jgi:hypothetical protein
MSVLARIIGVVLALTTLTAPAAVADGRHPFVVPADHVAGSSGSRILGDVFVENLSRPAAESPFGYSTDLCLHVGRHDKVLVPSGGVQVDGLIEMTCTVKVGRPVVVVMTSLDCSTAEAAPFFGATAAAQRTCISDFLSTYDVKSIVVSIDGGRPTDIAQPGFFEVSQQRHVVFDADDPVYQATPGPATFVAAAWMAEIRGMKRGTHTYDSTTTVVYGGQTSTTRFVVHFEVVAGNHGKH